jgi:integrase
MSGSARDLALIQLGDRQQAASIRLGRLKVEDVCSGPVVRDRSVIIQLKTGRSVQFEITEGTRQSIQRLLARWINNIGLDARGFETHSLRRTRVAQLFGKTGNLRVQLLLGHAKIETTVRYLGVEVDDALRLAEQNEL